MARPTPFAASHEPLQIFQDDFFEQPVAVPAISRAPMPSVNKQIHRRRPLQKANGNNMFNPPNGHARQQQSPFKAQNRVAGSPLAPLGSSRGNARLNSVSILPPSSHGMNTDSMQKKQPLMSKFKHVVQKPPMDLQQANFGKENVHPTLYPAPPPFSLNFDHYYEKAPGKRALLDAPTITDNRTVKRIKPEEPVLPAPDCFPAVVDDGGKPGHSYAQLIGMAILRAPQRRLTLSQIYKWISDSYSFYRANDAGWQNSIRHNLSLNKAFIKQERPKDDPGKGNYWVIEPGMEHSFVKDKTSRKAVTTTVENAPFMANLMEPAQIEPTIFQDGLPSLPPVLPAQHIMYPQESMPAKQLVQPTQEVSSDATIPLSDNAAPDDQQENVAEAEHQAEPHVYSPLPATMHSSPPIPRHLEPRSNTPPPIMRDVGSSASRKRTHKRKYASMDASMDDSGYISSLESSVMRPHQIGRVHSSGPDRHRIKRGRAEEEIARLRASSYDSPTKSRSRGLVAPSSSPLRRQSNEGQMLPPLTPAVKLQRPMKPPASVSPNTNLRIHRDNVRHMLNSPLRRVNTLSEGIDEWSTVIGTDEPVLNWDFLNDDHDIFSEWNRDPFFISATDSQSPLKKAVKRPRIDRTSSTSALDDITYSLPNNSITSSAPSLKPPPTPSVGLTYETPSKAFEGMSSPSKVFLQSPIAPSKATQDPIKTDWTGFEDFTTPHFLVEENTEDFSGMDILQGFEKIGSSSQNAAASFGKPPKPPLGRSYTSRF
ncbi:hypothetical protein F4778DRAFT_559404 [Xylariomycetidae sp. FL2044]|nr:hypothetical protein F4778DRAFT_559404 [Xylariomycetidae sp. FL2044]